MVNAQSHNQTVLWYSVQSIAKAIPAMNAHVQHFVANDELLLPILKAFANFICLYHATQEMLDIFSLCVIAEAFFALTNNSFSVYFIVITLSAPRQTHVTLVSVSYWPAICMSLVRAV
jgi:hypothetical protein